MVDRETQMQRLLGYYTGYLATQLIRLGLANGLFERLAQAQAPLRALQLAGELGLHTPYVERFLQAAYALHLVDCDTTGGYSLAPHMATLLGDPQGTRHLGSVASLLVAIGDDFSHMDALLHSGARYPYPDHGQALVDAIAASTASIAGFVVRTVVSRLPSYRGRDDLAVLDIGCGEGGALLALAAALPRGRIVGLDVEPRSVEVAARRIREAGLEGRVRAQLADARDLALQSEFDLVTMIQVLHELDPAIRPEVLRRAHDALRPGGILLIVDEPYPNDAAGFRDAPVSVLTQFVEAFWGNTFLSMDEQKAMVQQAGFQVLSQIVPPPGLICLTTAQKA